MRKTGCLLTTLLVVVALWSSVALALPPLGPPHAIHGKGQWAVDVEYAHESIDLEAWGICTEGEPIGPGSYTYYCSYENVKINDLKTNMFFGSLGYGLCDWWDIFIRLGVADAQDELVIDDCDDPNNQVRLALDGGYGFAWGVGTRMTFCQSGPWTFGGVCQFTWLDPDNSAFTWSDSTDPNQQISGNIDFDFWEFQTFIGATLLVSEGCSVYAGPFMHFVKGDMNVVGSWTDGIDSGPISCSTDVREKSQIGGAVGGHCEFDNGMTCYVEGQFTGDAWGVGAGAIIPFEMGG